MATKLKKKNVSVVKKVVKKVKQTSQQLKQAGSNAAARVFQIPKVGYAEGVGRRKTATARVRIYEGDGDFVVNNKVVGDYFGNLKNSPVLYNKPFQVTGTQGKFAVTVKVSGSGISAQLGALQHGLSRALIKFNPDYRGLLKAEGLLTRDDRMKETRKIGHGGKARRKRQSPKR